MPAGGMWNNLGDWQNPPIIQDQVIAYMESFGAAMLLREIYRPLQLPRTTVNRVLGRLHAKGVVTRYKIPVSCHRYDRRAQSIQPDGAIRQCYLYSFADEAEDNGRMMT